MRAILLAAVFATASAGASQARQGWLQTPSRQDVAAVHPSGASGAGRAVLDCRILRDGRLAGCRTLDENPRGQGFARAAHALTSRFRAAAAEGDRRARLPFQFDGPQGPPAYLSEAPWRAAPTPQQITETLVSVAGADGRAEAVVDCAVAPGGALTDCRSLRASPEAAGPTALALAPSFVLSPWTEAGRPTAGARLRLPIQYATAPETAGPSGAPAAHEPEWDQRPSVEELAQAAPRSASGGRESGEVAMRCRMLASGHVEMCRVVSETPAGRGFGEAALRMAPRFRMGPRMRRAGAEVTIPIRFEVAGEDAPGVIEQPRWVASPGGEEMARFYPREAMQADLNGGAVIECRVAASGVLVACRVLQEGPAGYGFGAAALRMSRFFRMGPTDEAGRPVEGRTVRLPIRWMLSR